MPPSTALLRAGSRVSGLGPIWTENSLAMVGSASFPLPEGVLLPLLAGRCRHCCRCRPPWQGPSGLPGPGQESSLRSFFHLHLLVCRQVFPARCIHAAPYARMIPLGWFVHPSQWVNRVFFCPRAKFLFFAYPMVTGSRGVISPSTLSKWWQAAQWPGPISRKTGTSAAHCSSA